MTAAAYELLEFWFGPPGTAALAESTKWWKKDEAFDREIAERFQETLERGVRGELSSWQATPRGRLALVILYDQFSRNIFRGTARSFAQDPLARDLALQALAAGDDRVLTPVEVSFLLMPFMHAEDVGLQQRCIDGFAELRDAATDEKVRANFESSHKYAKLHKVIIDRFGRFPHRNAIVDRPTTPEEAEFLTQPGSSF